MNRILESTCRIVLLLSIMAAHLPAQECGPFVTGSGMDGDFLLGVSYFGAVGITNPAQRDADLETFRAIGLNNVRVWANWTHWGAQNSTVFDENGDVNPNAMGRLVALTQKAEQENMTVDVTFTWRHFVQNQCVQNNKEYCLPRFTAGVVETTKNLLLRRNVFFDLGNESNAGGQANLKLTNEELEALEAAIGAVDPSRVLTVSSVGSPEVQGDRFDPLLNDDVIDFASPHFRRTTDWDTQTDDRIAALRSELTGSWPLHLQEESRRGETCGDSQNEPCCAGHEDPPPPNPDSYCQLNDFLTALGLAAEAGAAGWVFHTDAGFQLDDPSKPFFSELDQVEEDVLASMTMTLGATRCLPPPVYSDNFNDAVDDTWLEGRALQSGSAIWDTSFPAWRLEFQGGRVTTAGPNFAPVGSVPFHLPVGFIGTASVEADLTNNVNDPAAAAEGVSIGFSLHPEAPLAVQGVYYVSLETDGISIYEGPGSIELATIAFLVPVSEASLRLEYEGGAQPMLRLYSREPFVGWNQLASIEVDERAVDFAVLSIDQGVNGESFVDNFAARYVP